MADRKLHICIDCGGSKTAAAVSTYIHEPILVSRGYGGPSNYKDNGLKVFLSAIRQAAQDALTHALGVPISLPTVDNVLTAPDDVIENHRSYLYSAWIGASGVDAAQDVLTLSPLLSRLLGVPLTPQRLMVQNDSHILSSPLLTTAESVRESIVAIAGTGSVVVSFRRQKLSPQDASETIVQLARAGGWGYLLGDEGSGFRAGREAIREVLRTFNESDLDEEPPVSESQTNNLRSMILAHFSLRSPEDLFSVVYAPDSVPKSFVDRDGERPRWTEVDRKSRIVELCPLVFHAAFQLKDKSAIRALRTSLGGLAKQVSSLCTGAGVRPSSKRISAPSAVLCLGGSLFKVNEYRELFIEELETYGQRFGQVVYIEDACKGGALGLAKLFP